ncbi:hypothetical protein ELI13_27870 (plasmid) [Rhizobium ruizarguesonis]|uniref:hypothetical protein n=1 Tax=Rhizobium ruizarguesonis TaxID=2081791 RepID=UPI00102F4877|nr:hypothetical protein [Rhizobium ruizarguesonis]QND24850.1 hypothetical protein HB774_36785 [Rhizobium leguminosarum bv. viciae]TAT70656.1 hypothetical protein ELI56_34760 [Rhizobium ruizarguesonis]TAT75363.1 hypothetical protein ELI54_32005 [Rhizobium ruizarguesonis]TAU61343.1 hypothetical protein ELI46_32340 [Rhizobium ruizarguesonis]TAW03712.1 hypothetical protein ELI25_35240 [Rhizobium ruizarguesonis]
MFLRHDPSSLCNTTGAHLAVAISTALRDMLFGRQGLLDITVTEAPNLDGCVKVDVLSNFALLYSNASPQLA